MQMYMKVWKGISGGEKNMMNKCRDWEKQGELLSQDIARFKERGEISDLPVASPGALRTKSLVICSD